MSNKKHKNENENKESTSNIITSTSEKIDKADALRIQLNFANIEVAKRDIDVNTLNGQVAEVTRRLHVERRCIVEQKVRTLKGDHDKFLIKLKERTGLDIKGKLINFDTLEFMNYL